MEIIQTKFLVDYFTNHAGVHSMSAENVRMVVDRFESEILFNQAFLLEKGNLCSKMAIL